LADVRANLRVELKGYNLRGNQHLNIGGIGATYIHEKKVLQSSKNSHRPSGPQNTKLSENNVYQKMECSGT
jgi:hypothetical protein